MYIRTYFNPALRKNRKLWGHGPWSREPDGARFWHAGILCEVIRNSLGNLCGYVLISDGHPWYGCHYDAIDACAHGGLTFADANHDGRWRVGFDCAHLGDLIPFGAAGCPYLPRGFYRRAKRGIGFLAGTYRNMQWVVRETMCLAKQAREAST